MVAESLGLKGWGFTLYSCRHGGPSADRADGSRSLPEIQRRGRWAADSSVKRYEQAGRLHVVLDRTPAAILDHCVRCEVHLVQLLKHPRGLVLPKFSDFVAPAPEPQGEADD